MLSELGVAWQPSDMSFSLRCERTGLEYNGTSLNSLFAQRRNIVRPSFLRMIARHPALQRPRQGMARRAGLAGCHRSANSSRQAATRASSSSTTSCRWVARSGLPRHPAMLGFPARFFIGFFDHHGFLSVDDRPVWQTVTGGSREYVRALLAASKAPRASRDAGRAPSAGRPAHVLLRTRAGDVEAFDHVFLACHSRPGAGAARSADARGAGGAGRDAVRCQRGDAAHRCRACCRGAGWRGPPGTTTCCAIRRSPSRSPTT